MPAPALTIQFGSALNSVYNRPMQHDQLVVAPCLLGSELNVTIFHDIRDELERVMRESQNVASWSFEADTKEGSMVTFPSRELTARSGTVQDVVGRICRYFSIEAGSVGFGLAYRRGEPVGWRHKYRGGATYVRAVCLLPGSSSCRITKQSDLPFENMRPLFVRFSLSHTPSPFSCQITTNQPTTRPEHHGSGCVREPLRPLIEAAGVRRQRRSPLRFPDQPLPCQQLRGSPRRGRAWLARVGVRVRAARRCPVNACDRGPCYSRSLHDDPVRALQDRGGPFAHFGHRRFVVFIVLAVAVINNIIAAAAIGVASFVGAASAKAEASTFEPQLGVR
jgi:hypothetical protein